MGNKEECEGDRRARGGFLLITPEAGRQARSHARSRARVQHTNLAAGLTEVTA